MSRRLAGKIAIVTGATAILSTDPREPAPRASL